MNRRPERLADLLPGVVAELAARHNTTNGAPMSRFRKKPVVIEAVQYVVPLDGYTLPGWWVAAVFDGTLSEEAIDGTPHLVIRTLEDGPNGEAKHVADRGDWIIRGVKGELYACKPDIFEATYEPVDGAA